MSAEPCGECGRPCPPGSATIFRPATPPAPAVRFKLCPTCADKASLARYKSRWKFPQSRTTHARPCGDDQFDRHVLAGGKQ